MNKPEFLTPTKVPFAERYDNFIGGQWVAPKSGKYFDNISPVTGKVVCKIARSEAADLRLRTAIESISESFVLWDAAGRLVMGNTKGTWTKAD